MIVVSPWTKGGWVNSEVFDHTSLIQFVERRFGNYHSNVIESNITKWRRAITGDLTSAFNFASPNDATVPLPSTIAYKPADDQRHPDYIPTVPNDQALPQQEHGARPARALPYELHAHGEADISDRSVKLHFRNSGRAAAVFQVRSGDAGVSPRTYTVGDHDEITDDISTGRASSYDLSVYGPNGFLRTFAGSFGSGNANLEVRSIYDTSNESIAIVIRNKHNSDPEKVEITDAYTGQVTSHQLQPHGTLTYFSESKKTFGWYDVTVQVASDVSFRRQFAGHVENGCDSMTDPLIGQTVSELAKA